MQKQEEPVRRRCILNCAIFSFVALHFKCATTAHPIPLHWGDATKAKRREKQWIGQEGQKSRTGDKSELLHVGTRFSISDFMTVTRNGSSGWWPELKFYNPTRVIDFHPESSPVTVSLKIGEREQSTSRRTREGTTQTDNQNFHYEFIWLSCPPRFPSRRAAHLEEEMNLRITFRNRRIHISHSVCPSLGLNYYNVHINIPEEEHCKFNHLTLRFASEGCCAGWSDCCASISSRFILMEASHCSQS